MAADAELLSSHEHREFNSFQLSHCIVSDLPKPDHLHTMQIGMLVHVQKWIFYFMRTPERLDKYNGIRLSVPAYHDLTPKNMSDEEVSQWNGKEMNKMSRYLGGVVTQSLWGRCRTQRPFFNRAIDCTRAFSELSMYAQHESHDDATLRFIDNALHSFHTFKDVFLLGQAGKKA